MEPLEQRFHDLFGKGVERLRIAEERGDGNQQVGEQFLCLVGMPDEIAIIGIETVLAGDLHAPRDTPQDRCPLVVGKVVARASSQIIDDLADVVLRLLFTDVHRASLLRMVSARRVASRATGAT